MTTNKNPIVAKDTLRAEYILKTPKRRIYMIKVLKRDGAIKEFDIKDLNLLILENVGNLVCPAEFDTGSHLNMMLLSVPEGHDKPLKYPLMFQVSQIAVITKMDTLPVFKFDAKLCEEYIHRRNPDARVFTVSAIKQQGIEELVNELEKRMA